jgi:hypothetical protein
VHVLSLEVSTLHFMHLQICFWRCAPGTELPTKEICCWSPPPILRLVCVCINLPKRMKGVLQFFPSPTPLQFQYISVGSCTNNQQEPVIDKLLSIGYQKGHVKLGGRNQNSSICEVCYGCCELVCSCTGGSIILLLMADKNKFSFGRLFSSIIL